MKLLKRFMLIPILLFTTIHIHLYASDRTSIDPSTVIAVVDTEKITIQDLEFAYKKTPYRQYQNFMEIPYDSIRSFLDLYINFRLKVLEAKNRGYHKDSALLAEIQSHRNAIAIPFYFERVLIDPNAWKIAKRREEELKIAVILVGKQEDSLKALQKALQLLDSLHDGKDFAELARRHSDDKFSADKGGELPWITGGQILRELEDAVYTLKPGQLYKSPVNTKFGYFIAKLLRREPHILVKGRHILITVSASRDSLAALRRADSVLQALRQGADFAALAKQYSDDRNSANNGGDLGGYYSRSLGLIKYGGRRFVPEFETALFNLKDGEISQIIKTNFGYHIIRRDSSKRMSAGEALEDAKRYYKATYFQEDRRKFLDSAGRALGFGWNEVVFQKFIEHLDTTKTTLDSAWDSTVPQSLRNEILYYTSEGGLTVGAWIDSLKNQTKYQGVALRTIQMRSAINRAMENVLLQTLTKDLEKRYPDFAQLMREFFDGMLLFKIESEEVWNKVRFDSIRARSYYDSTKQRYKTGKRYEISEIYILSKKVADSLYSYLQSHPDEFSAIAEQTTQRHGYREKKGYWGEVDSSVHPIAQKISEKNPAPGSIILLPYERGYSIVYVHNISPPRMKTFEEAIPDFAPQLQEEIQKEISQSWLSQLRRKYKVRVNDNLIRKIWKK